jgi:hypothetical protein
MKNAMEAVAYLSVRECIVARMVASYLSLLNVEFS